MRFLDVAISEVLRPGRSRKSSSAPKFHLIGPLDMLSLWNGSFTDKRSVASPLMDYPTWGHQGPQHGNWTCYHHSVNAVSPRISTNLGVTQL